MMLLIKIFISFLCLMPLGCWGDEDGNELLFVQTVWRHGDRTPTETFLLDINQEGAWPQGFGELTEWGMRQHLNLGKKLRSIYVDKLKFLSPEYRSNEIYVRSTDVNRTMISAIANLIAMYPGSAESSGITYPNTTDWPTYQVDGKQVGYVPIPIHTVNDFYDYTLNPDMICPRQDALWKLVEQTPEYQEATKANADLLKTVSDYTGVNVTLTNLWLIADALFIEKTWNKTWNTGIDENLFQKINISNDLVEYWNNGLQLKPFKGIDFSVELPKIRGGTLFWTLINNMQMKLNCNESNNTENYCSFFGDLKYYAYSAHDTTLAALFSVLGLKYTNWNEDGYPHYSSAVSIELWRNSLNKIDTVKFIYFPLSSDRLNHDQDEMDIPACAGPCTMASLTTQFANFTPTPDAATLCNTELKLVDNPAIRITLNFWNFAIIFVFGILFKIYV